MKCFISNVFRTFLIVTFLFDSAWSMELDYDIDEKIADLLIEDYLYEFNEVKRNRSINDIKNILNSEDYSDFILDIDRIKSIVKNHINPNNCFFAPLLKLLCCDSSEQIFVNHPDWLQFFFDHGLTHFKMVINELKTDDTEIEVKKIILLRSILVNIIIPAKEGRAGFFDFSEFFIELGENNLGIDLNDETIRQFIEKLDVLESFIINNILSDQAFNLGS